MAAQQTVLGDTRVNGTFVVTGATTGFKRTSLDDETLKSYEQNILDARIHDNIGVHLDNTHPSDDDLKIEDGTFGTDTPSIQSGDIMALGAKTRRTRMLIRVPENYTDGKPLTLRLRAGMKTTIAGTSATIDAECYLSNKEALIHATQTGDMCTTTAIDINSLTLADRDFTLTPTYVIAGDLLDVRITMSITDASEVTAVIGVLGSVQLVCTAKG